MFDPVSHHHLICIILLTIQLFVLQGDEAYVLPVLLRFDGHPEVDDMVSTLFVLHVSSTMCN